jgi:hypothetical protein
MADAAFAVAPAQSLSPLAVSPRAGLQTFSPRPWDWPVPTCASVSPAFGALWCALLSVGPPAQTPEHQPQEYLLRKGRKSSTPAPQKTLYNRRFRPSPTRVVALVECREFPDRIRGISPFRRFSGCYFSTSQRSQMARREPSLTRPWSQAASCGILQLPSN